MIKRTGIYISIQATFVVVAKSKKLQKYRLERRKKKWPETEVSVLGGRADAKTKNKMHR